MLPFGALGNGAQAGRDAGGLTLCRCRVAPWQQDCLGVREASRGAAGAFGRHATPATHCLRGEPMATTRRKLLQTAGAVAAGSVLLKKTTAKAATQPSEAASPRGLAYCMLTGPKGLSLGVRQGGRILDVERAGKALRVAVPGSTDDVIAGRNLDGLQKVLAAGASL